MDDKSDAAAVHDGLLERWARGERGALDALLTQFDRDVHQIAVSQLRGERHSTLRPTALVH